MIDNEVTVKLPAESPWSRFPHLALLPGQRALVLYREVEMVVAVEAIWVTARGDGWLSGRAVGVA